MPVLSARTRGKGPICPQHKQTLSCLCHPAASGLGDRLVSSYQTAAEELRYEAHTSSMSTRSKVGARQTQISAAVEGRRCRTAQRCCPGFVLVSASLFHPIPQTTPNSSQHWGHSRQRCSATHRMVCLQFTSVE